MSVALIALCQACSLSHTHTEDTHERRRTGAYRTLNKRGRIPDVFPHEVTSCSGGKNGMLGIHWGNRPRRTLPPPKDLSALFMFFHHSPSLPPPPSLTSLSSSLDPSPPSPHPPPLPSHPDPSSRSSLIPPAGIARLDLKLWSNICLDAKGKKSPSEFFDVVERVAGRDWNTANVCVCFFAKLQQTALS